MQNTNENKEDKQKMEPTENCKPNKDNNKTSEENYQTSENYGAENYKTPYDDEEKLIGLVEPNSELAPPAYIDGPEAPRDYGKKSESHPPKITWKRRILFLVFAFVCSYTCSMGLYYGSKYYDNKKAVSDKIPCHKMSHKAEGVALVGDLEDHHGDSKGHHASMGTHHRRPHHHKEI